MLRAAALSSIACVAAMLVANEASAHPGITGYSGKPYNGVSETCTTNCHAKGGTAPSLNITVPATVQAGVATAVTVVVTGTRTRTSLNAAFSDGVKTIKGSNTDTPLPAQEPTEVGAIVPAPNGASATYQFSFIAPNVNGPIMMWVAGMSANGAGTAGDGVANATRMITVTGATADAGTTTDGGSSGGTTDAGGDASTSGDGGNGTHDGGGSSGGNGASSGRPAGSGEGSDSGCSVSTTSPGSSTSTSLAVWVMVMVMGIGGVLRRRRG